MKTFTIVLLVLFVGVPTVLFTAFRFMLGRFGYVQKPDQVVYRTFDMGNGGLVEKVLNGADPPTFRKLASGYAKDQNQVYFKGFVLKGCNPSQFKIIDYTWKFSCDDQGVYYCARLISKNPSGFEPLDYGFARDSQFGYRYSKVLPGSHGPTFQLIPGTKVYTKDHQHVYSLDRLLEGADAPSFELLDGYYSRDKNVVYYSGQVVKEADPQSFKFLGHHYGRDKSYVYWKSQILKEADPATFRVKKKGSTYEAFDKSQSYSWGKRSTK